MNRAYGQQHLKGPREDQVFRYETLALEECLVKVVNHVICKVYMEHVTCNHDLYDSTLMCSASSNKLLKSKIKISIRTLSYISILKVPTSSLQERRLLCPH